jgi:hypothetical protein
VPYDSGPRHTSRTSSLRANEPASRRPQADDASPNAGQQRKVPTTSIVIDTVGLLLGVLVTAASVQDSIAGQTLIERTRDIC